MASKPSAPTPRTAADSPRFASPRVTARTTTASGSASISWSSLISAGAGQQQRAGRQACSAKPPWTSMPMAVRARQRLRLPSRQSGQIPQE